VSVRKEVEALLSADWAEVEALAGVRVIATERELDELESVTALLRTQSVSKAPSAPNSHRHVGLLLTLVHPSLDLDRAGDEMEDIVSAALDYLDPRFLHDAASYVGYGDRLAVDIPLTILASKD
jgi:hypothetical protein